MCARILKEVGQGRWATPGYRTLFQFVGLRETLEEMEQCDQSFSWKVRGDTKRKKTASQAVAVVK